jgi:uncharacterized phage infection (PIP) family protein YhgE
MDAILTGLNEKQQQVNDELGTYLLQGAADMAAAGQSIQQGADQFNAAVANFNPTVTVTIDQDGQVLAG